MLDLYFDIECIPTGSPSDVEMPEITAPGNYKDPKKITEYIERKEIEQDASRDKLFRDRCFDALTGEIISIAWAIGDDAIQTTGCWNLSREFDLIQDFFDRVVFGYPTHKRLFVRWIGHNILKFDLPYLWQRCVLLNIKPPFLIPKNARSGGDHVFDTMIEWGNQYDKSTWKSQSVLAKAFGLEPQETGGADVYDQWLAKDYEAIRTHNILDVEEVRILHKRMML